MESSCKVTPRPNNIKEFFTTWYFWKPFLGVLVGVTGGFLYYYFVENSGDSFTFTNETYSSMFFGAVLGYFVTGSPCSRFGR